LRQSQPKTLGEAAVSSFSFDDDDDDDGDDDDDDTIRSNNNLKKKKKKRQGSGGGAARIRQVVQVVCAKRRWMRADLLRQAKSKRAAEAAAAAIEQHEQQQQVLLPHLFKNKHIQHAYTHRETHAACFATLYRWDNESLNVYTALLGTLVFSMQLCWVLQLATLAHSSDSRDSSSNSSSSWPPLFAWALLGPICNSVLVASYHLFVCMPEHYHWYSALDLLGVLVMLSGIGVMFIELRLVPQEILACLLLSTTTTASGSSGGSGDACCWLLLVGWLLMSCTCAVAAVHTRVTQRRESTKQQLILYAGVLMASIFYCSFRSAHVLPNARTGVFFAALGLVLYMSKFPECVAPSSRIIDLFCSSHSMWHLFYTIAIGLLINDLIRYKYRDVLSPPL
jgi:hypothetical protein